MAKDGVMQKMISNRPIRAICTEVSRHGVTILKNDHLKKIISEKRQISPPAKATR